jgi:uncharacterized protein YkvS
LKAFVAHISHRILIQFLNELFKVKKKDYVIDKLIMNDFKDLNKPMKEIIDKRRSVSVRRGDQVMLKRI